MKPNVLPWSGGHEFKPQQGWTWGAWYFCPKLYLNQAFHITFSNHSAISNISLPDIHVQTGKLSLCMISCLFKGGTIQIKLSLAYNQDTTAGNSHNVQTSILPLCMFSGLLKESGNANRWTIAYPRMKTPLNGYLRFKQCFGRLRCYQNNHLRIHASFI